MTSKDLTTIIVTHCFEDKKKGTMTYFAISVVVFIIAILKGFSPASVGTTNLVMVLILWGTLYAVSMIYIDHAKADRDEKERREKDRKAIEERQRKVEEKAEKKDEYSEKDVRTYYQEITDKVNEEYTNGDWKAVVKKENGKWVKELYCGSDRKARKPLK